MSAIGDRLRQAAKEADAGKDFTAFAVIVTENSSCRFFLSHIENEDEARTMCARGLINVLDLPPDNRQEQAAAAASWDVPHEEGGPGLPIGAVPPPEHWNKA